MVPDTFQCRGVQIVLKVVGQGPSVFAKIAGEDCLACFLSTTISLFSFVFFTGPLSWRRLSRWIKYWFKEPLTPKHLTKLLYECLIIFFTHLYLYVFCRLFKIISCMLSRSLSKNELGGTTTSLGKKVSRLSFGLQS